jgi:hypothetical protein
MMIMHLNAFSEIEYNFSDQCRLNKRYQIMFDEILVFAMKYRDV